MNNETRKIAVVCLVGMLLLGATAWQGWQQMGYNSESRREMRHFIARLRLGDTPQQVQQKFVAGSYKTIKLVNHFSSTRWQISTPLEWGAGNWSLNLEFHENKLVAIRLRTMDGGVERPRETAPPDQIARGWNEAFP